MLTNVGDQEFEERRTGWNALVRPMFVGSVSFLAATTTAGMANWDIGPTTVLAIVAFIDGLFLTAYVQAKY